MIQDFLLDGIKPSYQRRMGMAIDSTKIYPQKPIETSKPMRSTQQPAMDWNDVALGIGGVFDGITGAIGNAYNRVVSDGNRFITESAKRNQTQKPLRQSVTPTNDDMVVKPKAAMDYRSDEPLVSEEERDWINKLIGESEKRNRFTAADTMINNAYNRNWANYLLY